MADRAGEACRGLGGGQEGRRVRIIGDGASDLFVGLGVLRGPVGGGHRLGNHCGRDLYDSQCRRSLALALRSEMILNASPRHVYVHA